MKRLTIIIEQDEDGFYIAEVRELPGCFTQAKTLNELLDRLKEAIELYLEEIAQEKMKIPRTID